MNETPIKVTIEVDGNTIEILIDKLPVISGLMTTSNLILCELELSLPGYLEMAGVR